MKHEDFVKKTDKLRTELCRNIVNWDGYIPATLYIYTQDGEEIHMLVEDTSRLLALDPTQVLSEMHRLIGKHVLVYGVLLALTGYPAARVDMSDSDSPLEMLKQALMRGGDIRADNIPRLIINIEARDGHSQHFVHSVNKDEKGMISLGKNEQEPGVSVAPPIGGFFE